MDWGGVNEKFLAIGEGAIGQEPLKSQSKLEKFKFPTNQGSSKMRKPAIAISHVLLENQVKYIFV